MKNKEEVLSIIRSCHNLVHMLGLARSNINILQDAIGHLDLFKEINFDKELSHYKASLDFIIYSLKNFIKDKMPDHSEIGCNCNE